MRALIFDCDGVLGETESRGHLAAFNRMWREFGVPWQWTLDQYRSMLRIGGGRERMLALLASPCFQNVWQPPASEQDRRALVTSWHCRKSEIFQELVESGCVPARAGVRRLAAEALDCGWLLAVASTAAGKPVSAMMRRVFDGTLAARFSVVLAGDVVANKKPNPEIYSLCSRLLDTEPAQCVVVEDSSIGVAAAKDAGMRCLVTVSETSTGEDFSRADLVVSSLGDPGGDLCRVLENRSNTFPHGWVTIGDLEQL